MATILVNDFTPGDIFVSSNAISSIEDLNINNLG